MTEQVLTDLFTAQGSACRRFATQGGKRTWKTLVMETLERHGACAVAYEERGSGTVVCAPRGTGEVDAQAVIGVIGTHAGAA